MLTNKHILVGLTGGIACYKTAYLIRLLKKQNNEVKVVMSDHAKQFITPLTLATLSQNPVFTEFFEPTNGQWNSHVSLGTWADAYVIAPATANAIAKMANGIADNLLLTTYLSARCPVFIAPAMDLDMWQHPTTKRNLQQLEIDGVHIVEPGTGFLASGLEGKGRMAEPEEIVASLDKALETTSNDAGKQTILITAGPTQEAIDPVRFISNRSTGKMGFALAEAAAQRGLNVELVTGPVNLPTPHYPNIHRTNVTSASQMADVAIKLFPNCSIAILSAAVADFAPANVATRKIKKDPNSSTLTLSLSKTTDIAATLGKMKQPNQILVGFALETDNEHENAVRKLKSKNLDLIVLNSLQDKGAGFGTDTNKVTLIKQDGTEIPLPLELKSAVAQEIIKAIIP